MTLTLADPGRHEPPPCAESHAVPAGRLRISRLPFGIADAAIVRWTWVPKHNNADPFRHRHGC